MALRIKMCNVFLFGVLVLLSLWVLCVKATVKYDQNSIIVNGDKKILISGSIHYPRSTPEMWPDLIQKAKEGGLDVIQTYVFWNGHEPEQGKYYFEDRYDLVKFIKLVDKAGLYVNLRIGPYVCAEWNFGGFPVWLKYVPNISFRTNNDPFMDAMKKFTTKIVNMMKDENLYETQGGPIILSQIENEYGPMENGLGEPGNLYTKWAAEMAVGLDTDVPWIMCKQDDAPDPIINTCNGFYCDYFSPNTKNKPKMWTEAWTAWFTAFGNPVPYRPVEDLAFGVAKFIQKGGSFINYYMYHGGTNFGRTAGGPFIATSYDYDAPIDEYGLLRQPKWGHLKDLHRAIKICEEALVSGNRNVKQLGKSQEASVFYYKDGSCAAFLANSDPHSSATVSFQNRNYELPAWSISILPDCKNVVYNTAKISAQSTNMKMTNVDRFKWKSFTEEAASDDVQSFEKFGLVDQLDTTWDKTDYLWGTTNVYIDANEEFLKNGNWPVLTVGSAGDALYVYINGQLSGNAHGKLDHAKFTFSGPVKLRGGDNKISLLSVSVGLPNIGPGYETRKHGVHGPVVLSGLKGGNRSLTSQTWTYKIGMKGEFLSLYTRNGTSSVKWLEGPNLATRIPLTWYKASFKVPDGNDPLALDMDTMSKGQVWINGQSIGRYWSEFKASGDCDLCNYPGWFTESKCVTGCDEPSQRWYHVPRAWLNPTKNFLVVFEEWGGDPNGIALVKRVAENNGK
ncbi:hypothetical protein CASFOL_038573 [Castilleja foliolosa]|uniref:Beta-galactosidase n=1 Tax=Castilleja foliolosa TaxID=1961234 RepID=A0ABD3BLU7_9LAMI